MKYNLLPPFPFFAPRLQFKLKDTVILNTVDSILAITVSPCAEHKTTNPGVCNQKCEEKGELNYKRTYCVNDLVTDSKVEPNGSQEEARLCVVGITPADVLRKDQVTANKVEIASNVAPEKTVVHSNLSCTCCESSIPALNCDHLIERNLVNNNCKLANDTQSTGCSSGFNRNKSVKEECLNNTSNSLHLSSFNFKTFSVGADSEAVLENTSTSTVIDGTSFLDIQITTAADTPYKLLESLQDSIEMKDHGTPCIHTRVVSLDVERYINDALNASDELKGKYWLLRNYSTLLVDVCEGSQRVIMHVVVLISVQENVEKVTK
jgi:hypothetical protein